MPGTSRPMARIIMESLVVAVVASLACLVVMKLLGTEVRPAILGGTVGAITAAVMVSRAR